MIQLNGGLGGEACSAAIVCQGTAIEEMFVEIGKTFTLLVANPTERDMDWLGEFPVVCASALLFQFRLAFW